MTADPVNLPALSALADNWNESPNGQARAYHIADNAADAIPVLIEALTDLREALRDAAGDFAVGAGPTLLDDQALPEFMRSAGRSAFAALARLDAAVTWEAE